MSISETPRTMLRGSTTPQLLLPTISTGGGRTHGFEDIAAWYYWPPNLTGEHGELPETVQALGGSWNLLPMLGVDAAIGRTFTESEDRPDGNTAIVTWGLFQP